MPSRHRMFLFFSRSSEHTLASPLAMQSSKKRARLLPFRHGSYSSYAALAQCLRRVKDEGVPEATSSSSFIRARTATSNAMTPYGPLIGSFEVETSHGPEQLFYANPIAILHEACRTAKFGTVMRAKLLARPSTPENPWTLVFYTDEIGVTTMMIGKDLRKCEAFYWSFLEFGPEMLCQEAAWFVVSAARSIIVHDIEGAVSNMMRMLMHKFFSAGAHDFRTGVLLPVGQDGAPALFFARPGVVAGDEDGLKKLCGTKGSSGTKLCWDCQNMLNIRFKLTAKRVPWNVWSTSLDRTTWVPHTDVSVRAALEALRAVSVDIENGRARKSDLEDMETSFGFNHIPNCLLLDPDLGIRVSMFMHDWFHTYLQTGCWNYEFVNLMQFLEAGRVHVTWDDLRTFAERWTWPRRYQSPANLLRKDNIKDAAAAFGCSASEALNLIPVLACLLQTIDVPPGREPHVNSFLALCDVLDLLKCINIRKVDHALLDTLIMRHLTLFQSAYGELNWVYKHHVTAHIAEQLRRFGTLICLFTPERRHKVVKRFSHARRTAKGFEKGIMEELVCHMLSEFEELSLTEACLLDPVSPRANLVSTLRAYRPLAKTMLASRSLRTVGGATIMARDVVLLSSSDIGEVWFHCSIDGELLSCVSIWSPAPSDHDTIDCKRYRREDNPGLVSASDILTSLVHCASGNCVAVLIPLPWRDEVSV